MQKYDKFLNYTVFAWKNIPTISSTKKCKQSLLLKDDYEKHSGNIADKGLKELTTRQTHGVFHIFP